LKKGPTNLSVSVIMPTYNEAGNIADLIRETRTRMMQYGVQKFEIIVVDDNSPDETWKFAAKAIPADKRIRVIRRMKDHGLTRSISEGINAARHPVIIWMDCDFSHPPRYIPQLLFMIDQGFEVAVNSRYTVGGGEDRAGKGGKLQLFLSRALNWGTRFVLYPSFSDYTSGFIAIRKSVLKELPLRGDYGEYFIDLIFRIMSRNFKVCELPYFAEPRKSGESKTGTNLTQYWRRGRKYIWTILRLRFGGKGK